MADAASLRGSNQSGMRAHNERLVLTLVRRDGALAKSDIARITGLSAQTVSVIMRSAGGGRTAAARRADPGPDRPALGADVAGGGRRVLLRSEDRAAVGRSGAGRTFWAEPVGFRRRTYRYPTPEAVVRFVEEALPALRSAPALRAAGADRRAGHRDAVPVVELGPSTSMRRRARWTPGATAISRRSLSALCDMPVYCAERRDGRLWRGTGLRHGRAAAGFPVLLHRLLHRRRAGAERAALHRPHRQCGGRRADAGARAGRADAAADDGGLAVDAGRHAGRGGRASGPDLGKPGAVGDERCGAGALDRDGGRRAGQRHAERRDAGGDRHGDDRRLDARGRADAACARRRGRPSCGWTLPGSHRR